MSRKVARIIHLLVNAGYYDYYYNALLLLSWHNFSYQSPEMPLLYVLNVEMGWVGNWILEVMGWTQGKRGFSLYISFAMPYVFDDFLKSGKNEEIPYSHFVFNSFLRLISDTRTNIWFSSTRLITNWMKRRRVSSNVLHFGIQISFL